MRQIGKRATDQKKRTNDKNRERAKTRGTPSTEQSACLQST